QLGFIVTLQLVILVILVPFILVILTGKSIKALKGIVFITLMSGVGMAIPQVIIAKFTGAELPALVGSLFSILVTVWLTKRKTGSVEEVENESVSEIIKACSPFILVFIFVLDRKSTRLNSSHVSISYAVFCLKKKRKINQLLTLAFVPR